MAARQRATANRMLEAAPLMPFPGAENIHMCLACFNNVAFVVGFRAIV